MQITFLGQSGIIVNSGNKNIIIDPYLSNSLFHKYANQSALNYERLSKIIKVDFTKIDYYLITHEHTDHMDPLTIEYSLVNDAIIYIVPSGIIEKAQAKGIPKQNILPISINEEYNNENLKIKAIPAAHPDILKTITGGYISVNLGYIISDNKRTLYVSGDTLYNKELDLFLAKNKIDLAVLPINGYTPLMKKHGIIGNMDIEEATALCVKHNIPNLIPCHFDMFSFSTVSKNDLETFIKNSDINIIKLYNGDVYSFNSLRQ